MKREERTDLRIRIDGSLDLQRSEGIRGDKADSEFLVESLVDGAIIDPV